MSRKEDSVIGVFRAMTCVDGNRVDSGPRGRGPMNNSYMIKEMMQQLIHLVSKPSDQKQGTPFSSLLLISCRPGLVLAARNRARRAQYSLSFLALPQKRTSRTASKWTISSAKTATFPLFLSLPARSSRSATTSSSSAPSAASA